MNGDGSPVDAEVQRSEAPAFETLGPAEARTAIVLGHGAGQGSESGFMQNVATGLSSFGYRVILFDFPYMQKTKETGRKRPPDKMDVMVEHFKEVIRAGRLEAETLVIGGKSMGGRIATMIATDVKADGYVVFGYPFHPPGKPEMPRVAHLEAIKVPGLVLQGERDPFGKPDEVAQYPLNPSLHVHWVKAGDHSLVPSKSSGVDPQRALSSALKMAKTFIDGL